ncbi:hypothetical protein KKE06_04505 [Candidatus Micrarchaeota archaeon]|nr:hypothetical protein [Candidatus Micrarchaeota archaeon]MBU1930264.1 hypothetical protein [Candidatus Micrarchaeota archaeon]
MEKIFLSLAVFAFLLAGCSQPPEPPGELPADFEVEYESGAMHVEWGQYSLKIDSSGNAVFEKTMGMALSKKYEFNASESERKKIFDAAVTNGFFSLNEQYQDPSIMDGGWSSIQIKSDSETKTVTVTNFYLEQFDKVEAEITGLIVSRIGERAFSFDDLEEDCSQKKSECNGKDSSECNEWKDFCEWKGDINTEYCDAAENREECIEYCIDNTCNEELCDALLLDADNCTECGPGCCSLCNNLDACETIGCSVTWVHPSGESWQFGGCENTNWCAGSEEICDYLLAAYQGYAYHAFIEGNQEKAIAYEETSSALFGLYEEECN